MEIIMETELITAHEMCNRLNISMDTFRKTWRRWKHECVGRGYDLRSVRFYWEDGPVRAELDGGNIQISDKKRQPLDGGRLSGRRKDSKEGRIQKPARSSGLGGNAAVLAAAARRFGLA